MATNCDYSLVDLTELPEGYPPRTNYVPNCAAATYRARTPDVPWNAPRVVTDCQRLVNREMLS
jgi:hypothetical protein